MVEPESPLRVTRRRNSRATGGRPFAASAAQVDDEAVGGEAAGEPLRFKKRSPKEAAAEEVVGFALRAEFEAGVAPGGGSLAPARFDADAVAALLAGRLQTPKPKVHTEFKARCQELTDVNKQLRDALREHHEREKSQDGVLGGLEESVNAKLNALALDAKTHREAAERHKGELEASRAREADARKSLGQRGAELDAAKAEGARIGEARAAEQAAKETAEASLPSGTPSSRRRRRLSTSSMRRWRSSRPTSPTAPRRTPRKRRAHRELDGVKGDLATETAAKEATAAELEASRAAEAATTTKLEAADADRAELKAKLEKVEAQQKADAAEAAAKGSALEAAQATLVEKEKVLATRDADLRESIQSVASMAKQHEESLSHERAQSQALRDDLTALARRDCAAGGGDGGAGRGGGGARRAGGDAAEARAGGGGARAGRARA